MLGGCAYANGDMLATLAGKQPPDGVPPTAPHHHQRQDDTLFSSLLRVVRLPSARQLSGGALSRLRPAERRQVGVRFTGATV